EEESVTVSWLPLYHDMGLIGALLYPLYVGGRLVLMPPSAFIRRPMRWLEAIHKYRAGVSTAPDFAYQMCVERASDADIEQLDLSCWKLTVCGAEPLRPKTLDDFCDRFSATGFRRETFLPCHGMAEATLMVTGGAHDRVPPVRWFTDASIQQRAAKRCDAGTPGARAHVSCGRPTREHEVCIVDPSTCEHLPDGGVGELWFRGPSVCEGYWNRPNLSAQTFQARRDDGAGPWMRTGDLGFLEDGELFVLGRLHDLLRRDGAWIYPHLHEYDLEVAKIVSGPVVLVADPASPKDQQRIVAMAEIRKSRVPDAALIADQITQVLADANLRVDDVVLLPPRTIGRTSSGKLRRFRWAATLEMDNFAPVYPPTMRRANS
ncbi:MAG: AMP-binding protein, partial [Nannocystaceae bacterium]